LIQPRRGPPKKIPPKIREQSRKVIENTSAENAGFSALHYVDEKKDGYTLISIILMKRKGVIEEKRRVASVKWLARKAMINSVLGLETAKAKGGKASREMPLARLRTTTPGSVSAAT
jgi:hypothetical protein